jgi:hypothetical protein
VQKLTDDTIKEIDAARTPRNRKSSASDPPPPPPAARAGANGPRARARRRSVPRHVAIIMDGNGRWASEARAAARRRPSRRRRGGAQGD